MANVEPKIVEENKPQATVEAEAAGKNEPVEAPESPKEEGGLEEKIKEGPCGPAFIAAYKCYLESNEEEKGANCGKEFMAMSDCMIAHPEEFEEYFADEEEKGKDATEPTAAGSGEATETSGAEADSEVPSSAQTPLEAALDK